VERSRHQVSPPAADLGVIRTGGGMRSCRMQLAAIVLGASIAGESCMVNDPAYLAESQEFVETAVRVIVADWDPEELIKRSDPQFLKALPPPQVRELMATCSRELGHVKHISTEFATVGVNAGAWQGKAAQIRLLLDCEKTQARVTVVARKVEKTWTILGFHVDVKT
jgi:hypothetical protein